MTTEGTPTTLSYGVSMDIMDKAAGWVVLRCTTGQQVVEIVEALRETRGYAFPGWSTDSLGRIKMVADGYLKDLVCLYIRYPSGGATHGYMSFQVSDVYEPPTPAEEFLKDWEYNDR